MSEFYIPNESWRTRLWRRVRFSRAVHRVYNWCGLMWTRWKYRNHTPQQMLDELIADTAPPPSLEDNEAFHRLMMQHTDGEFAAVPLEALKVFARERGMHEAVARKYYRYWVKP